MSKIALLGVFLLRATPSQTSKVLLLPAPRHIVGTVVDPEGQPVGDADIGHIGDRWQVHQTDLEGRFTVDTKAPSIVVRKAGFRSELVRTQDVTDIRVTLHKLNGSRTFPNCSNTGYFEGIEGWSASFRFLRMSGVKASPHVSDIDYGVRYYSVATKHGRKGITHGSGPMWSLGAPSDLDVWQSAKYEETASDAGGLTIIDARGQLTDGSRWRYLGMVGESASYSGVDEATAKKLDQFLDGACVTGRNGQVYP